MTKAICVLSGGMDSTVMAYKAMKEFDEVEAVSFFYGQKHSTELYYAELTARHLNIKHDIVEIEEVAKYLTSALTSDNIDVPEGHYAAESMKATVVPNRNMIMASIAGGIAISRGANALGLGVHGGDHFIYPDCRPEFFDNFLITLMEGNAGFIDEDFRLFLPFINFTKTDVASVGNSLDVNWLHTWSCYKGAKTHCGKCGTCVERQEAFAEAAVIDPTVYERTS